MRAKLLGAACAGAIAAGAAGAAGSPSLAQSVGAPTCAADRLEETNA